MTDDILDHMRVLREQEDWDALAALLADADALSATDADLAPVWDCWADLEARSNHRMSTVYAAVIDGSAEMTDGTFLVRELLQDFSYWREALAVGQRLLTWARDEGDDSIVADMLIACGFSAHKLGELYEATALFKEAEDVCRRCDDEAQLAAALNGTSLILWTQGRLAEALEVMRAQEEICRRLDDLHGLQASLGNQAGVQRKLGRPDVAETLLREQVRLCRELDAPIGLSNALGDLAMLRLDAGAFEEASCFLDERESVVLHSGDRRGHAVLLHERAAILQAQSDLDGALALYRQSAEEFRALEDRDGLQASLANQATILEERDDLDAALRLRSEEAAICADLGDPYNLQAALGYLANDLLMLDRGEEARRILDEAVALGDLDAELTVWLREMREESGVDRAVSSAPRAVRVFVSSTFRDMVAERERLARFAFPALRELCEQRAVVFTDVDLRWGITEEQAAEGEVLPLCLAEIDASRPYFIGILGERYGWVPDDVAEELVELHPWLEEHRTRSVTELEIVHGVLNDPEMAGRAFFYFRDPRASRDLGDAGVSESSEAAARLSDLKARIRAGGFAPRSFSSAEELEAAVRADLAGAVDEEYPAAEVPDLFTRERMAHATFGAELVARFVPRPALSDALGAHAAGETPPLLLTGASGSGKSALLADFARTYAEVHPEIPVIVHFCGASAVAADWEALCRRVAAELELESGLHADLPDDPVELRSAFKDYLLRAAAARPCVLVVDGLDQLEDREAALELAFLPEVVPPGCRVVLGAASGTRPAVEAGRRDWPSLEVVPLTVEERPAVLAALLARRAKALDVRRMARICALPAAASPLFLAVLADELSVVGAHGTLDALLDEYLAVSEADDLYERVLARYERDYEVQRPGLVADVMRAIWAARRGISEPELLELLGNGEPLPLAHLAPLLLACGRQLTSRGGLLTFAHALLRKAVGDRYLAKDKLRRAAHLALAGLFSPCPLTPRALTELPWQLQQAGEWKRLAALLGDLEVLNAFWNSDQYDLRRSWAVLEANSEFRLTDVYAEAFGSADPEAPGVWELAQLALSLGRPQAVVELGRRLLEHVRRSGDRDALVVALSVQAGALMQLGAAGEASALYEEVGRIARDVDAPFAVVTSLAGQAQALLADGDLQKALVLASEAERLCRELDEAAMLGVTLHVVASILFRLDRLDEAEKSFEEMERVCREAGDPGGIASATAGRGVIFAQRGRLAEGMALLREEERLCRELGDVTRLRASLTNQRGMAMEAGDLGRVVDLYAEEEEICRKLDDAPGLLASLAGRAKVLMDLGRLDEAASALAEHERMCIVGDDLQGQVRSLELQAMLLGLWGDAAGSLAQLREMERISRELGDLGSLGVCLYNQALWLEKVGHADEALPLVEEAVAIARDLSSSNLGERLRLLERLREARLS